MAMTIPSFPITIMSFRSVTEIRVFETPWHELPENIRMHFNELEETAYTKGAVYFKEIAEQTKETTLVSLCDLLDDDQPMWAYLETEDTERPLVWFGFTFLTLQHDPQFRVKSEAIAPIVLPPRLNNIYQVFGGIRTERGDTGGLIPTEKMVSLETLARVYEYDLPMIGGEYYGFLSYGNGDYRCLNSDGRCVTFDHETGVINETDLNATLDDFLQELLQRPDFEEMFGAK